MTSASAGRVFLYDHGGHNFTYELARDLAADGTPMVYGFTEGVTAPHGRLENDTNLIVEALGKGRVFERYKLASRVWSEIRLGVEAARLARREKIGHVITCNMPVIIVAILAIHSRLSRRRLTVWFQDSQAGIARAMVDNGFAIRLVRFVEAWGLRQAERVIAISEAMMDEARSMGVKEERLRLLPNWAPISQIPVLPKKNDWSVEHGLDDTFVYLYSGTLGLKHSPERLTALARWIKDEGKDAVVLVVSEGPVADALRTESERDQLPLIVKPFQPAEVLPEVLATADVCIVLLEANASQFSVPSKVWSYMCAGRPILGSMPPENDAAMQIVSSGAGRVTSPVSNSADFIEAADELRLTDVANSAGAEARRAAESLFDPQRIRQGFSDAIGNVQQHLVRKSLRYVEWRPGGHRLAYANAVVGYASAMGWRCELRTNATTRTSQEFATHISALEDAAAVQVVEDDGLPGLRSLRRSLSASPYEQVIVPEADRHLAALLAMAVSRPMRHVTAIVMRPPSTASSKSLRIAKAALLRTIIRWPRAPRILLLEDPLASGEDRVWTGVFSSDDVRLDDPQDLFIAGEGSQPPELTSIPAGGFVSVVGSIDERKRIPELVTAFQGSAAGESPMLVIAGRQTPEVSRWLKAAGDLRNVSIINRYLDDAELTWLFGNSTAIAILYDGGISSGLLSAAAAYGTSVISIAGTRTDRVATRLGLALSVAEAKDVCQALASRPHWSRESTPVLRSTRESFARRIVDRPETAS